MAGWTPEERAKAREKSDRAYGSRSIRAQYAALREMGPIDRAQDGPIAHWEHCADRNCPEKRTTDNDAEDGAGN